MAARVLRTLAKPAVEAFGKAIKNLVGDVVEETVEETTKKVIKKVGRPKRKRGRKKSTAKKEKVTITPSGIPTGTATERLTALRKMKKGQRGSKERQRRGEITKILQQSERARRADIFPAPAERGGRTATVDPSTGQVVEGGVNTRLRSLHRPDYKEAHEQAVLFLREKFPGKSEKWYEKEAIKLVERDFPRVERGEEVISGTTQQVEAMLRGRKHGGIVRRRKGGAIGVGAALRGYGKGYKKGGKI